MQKLLGGVKVKTLMYVVDKNIYSVFKADNWQN